MPAPPQRGARPPRGRAAPGRDAAVALVQPRGLLARGGSPGPVHRESAGVTFLISVGISIVGEELSGAAPLRSSRRDGWFLLVSYQDASRQPPQPFHFTASVRPNSCGVLARFIAFVQPACAFEVWPRETEPGAPTALPTGSVSFGRCRRGGAAKRDELRAASEARGRGARASSASTRDRTRNA